MLKRYESPWSSSLASDFQKIPLTIQNQNKILQSELSWEIPLVNHHVLIYTLFLNAPTSFVSILSVKERQEMSPQGDLKIKHLQHEAVLYNPVVRMAIKSGEK